MEPRQPILIVEDHGINRDVAVLQLKALGWRSETAENGAEALRIFRPEKYSLVLMDVMMPEMDGLEAAVEIRKLESGSSRTPIIGVSAWDSHENREKCLQAGMDDYIHKPYDRQTLASKLEKWLGVGCRSAAV